MFLEVVLSKNGCSVQYIVVASRIPSVRAASVVVTETATGTKRHWVSDTVHQVPLPPHNLVPIHRGEEKRQRTLIVEQVTVDGSCRQVLLVFNLCLQVVYMMCVCLLQVSEQSINLRLSFNVLNTSIPNQTQGTHVFGVEWNAKHVVTDFCPPRTYVNPACPKWLGGVGVAVAHVSEPWGKTGAPPSSSSLCHLFQPLLLRHKYS